MIAAHRTLDQVPLELRLKIALRTEPPFESMVLRAAEIEDFHDWSMTVRTPIAASI